MAETEANKRQKCDQIALVKVLAANVGDRSMTYSGRPSVPEELQRTGGKTVLCGHANEIVPGLYLGSEQASAAPMKAALQELNVRTVVNCTFEPGLEPGLACASVFEGRRINYVRVAVRDEDSANILPYLPGAADLIQQQLQAGMFRTLAGAAYRVYQGKAWCFDYSTDPEGRVGRPYLYIHFRAWAVHLLQVPATHVICS